MSFSNIDSLEQELLQELEKFEHLLHDDDDQPSNYNFRSLSTSAFQLAEAEGEREVLQDRIYALAAKSEEDIKQINELQGKMLSLTIKNEDLLCENENLKRQLAIANQNGNSNNGLSPTPDKIKDSSDLYALLEYKLAETRSKLARAQQVHEDNILLREAAEKEAAHEKLLRLHAEKERDAYSAAYEASLKHFERWSQKKQSQKSFVR